MSLQFYAPPVKAAFSYGVVRGLAMGTGRGPPDTASTAGARQPDSHPEETAMKTFTAIPRSLTLGMLLAAATLFGTAAAADRIDINTADAATIDAGLVNIGRAKAEAIVAYREQHGAFKTPEQLAQVKGIGLKTVEKNRDRLEFGPGKPASAPKAAKKK